MGILCHWQPFWSTTRVRYIGQCWYFNPQCTAGQARNKASCVSKSITRWRELHSCYVSTYESGFLEGFRRWGDPCWLHRETQTFMGPAAYQNTVGCQIGVKKIPPNFDTLFAMSLEVVRCWRVKVLEILVVTWILISSFFINKYALKTAVILLVENQYFFVFYISIDQPNGY